MFSLPPVKNDYETERREAQEQKIIAGMELVLTGTVAPERRHLLDARPRAADGAYDPVKW